MISKQPFETVVAVHGATVLRICRAVLGPADADDAWSETFLSALKAYPALPADAKEPRTNKPARGRHGSMVEWTAKGSWQRSWQRSCRG